MFARICHTFMLTSFIFGALISNSFAAKIYHWVDEKGQAHYSETPPRNRVSEKLNVRPTGKGTAESSTSPNPSEVQKETADKKPKEAIKGEHTPEEKAKYCQQSRDLIQNMNGNSQRRFEQPDGSYRKLTPAEIADYRSQAQAGIEAYCQ
jgi:hypothetical protein